MVWEEQSPRVGTPVHPSEARPGVPTALSAMVAQLLGTYYGTGTVPGVHVCTIDQEGHSLAIAPNGRMNFVKGGSGPGPLQAKTRTDLLSMLRCQCTGQSWFSFPPF